MAFYSVATFAGPSLGPIMGAYTAINVGWRYIFVEVRINILAHSLINVVHDAETDKKILILIAHGFLCYPMRHSLFPVSRNLPPYIDKTTRHLSPSLNG